MFGTTMTAEEGIYREEQRQAEMDWLEQRAIEAHYEQEALAEEIVIGQYYAELQHTEEEIRLLMVASHDWSNVKGLI
jgi:hypothetical protein